MRRLTRNITDYLDGLSDEKRDRLIQAPALSAHWYDGDVGCMVTTAELDVDALRHSKLTAAYETLDWMVAVLPPDVHAAGCDFAVLCRVVGTEEATRMVKARAGSPPDWRPLLHHVATATVSSFAVVAWLVLVA